MPDQYGEENCLYGNPATLPFGGKIITIGETSYFVEGDCTPNFATRKIARTDQWGSQSDMSLWKEIATLSVTLQVPTRNSPVPATGASFSLYGVDWIVTASSPVNGSGGYWTCSITCETFTVVGFDDLDFSA